MADGKKKNYTLIKNGNRITLQMLEKGADGRTHSASCEYPLYLWKDVEKKVYDADGNESKVVEKQFVKQSRKQTEKFLLGILGL